MIQNKLKELITIPSHIVFDTCLTDEEKIKLIKLYGEEYLYIDDKEFMNKIVKFGYARYDKYCDTYELTGV